MSKAFRLKAKILNLVNGKINGSIFLVTKEDSLPINGNQSSTESGIILVFES